MGENKKKRPAVKELSRILDQDPAKMPEEAAIRHESLLINEISLVLAEKRTALSLMRTGLAVLVLPLSVLSVLIVISRYYEPQKVVYLLAPLLSLCGLLTIFGAFLIYRSYRRIRTLDSIITALKRQNTNLRRICALIDFHEVPEAVDEFI